MQLALLSATLLLASAAAASPAVNDTARVPVVWYGAVWCPECATFSAQLAIALNTTGINDLVRAEFYNTYTAGRVEDPYDCAKQKVDPNAGNLTKYCLQSRFYSCAMKVHCAIPEIKGGACPVADQKKLANFFPCAENAAGGHSSFSDALPCAKKWGLNVAAIQKCYDPSQTGYDSEPVEVIDLIGNATNSAKPTVQFFPDVRIGGKTLANPTAKAVIQAVCAATTGTKPAACSSEALALMM